MQPKHTPVRVGVALVRPKHTPVRVGVCQSSSRQIIIKPIRIWNRDLPLGVITARRPTKCSQPCSRYLDQSTAPSSNRQHHRQQSRRSRRELSPPLEATSAAAEPSRSTRPVLLDGEERPTQGEARRPAQSARRGTSAHQAVCSLPHWTANRGQP